MLAIRIAGILVDIAAKWNFKNGTVKPMKRAEICFSMTDQRSLIYSRSEGQNIKPDEKEGV